MQADIAKEISIDNKTVFYHLKHLEGLDLIERTSIFIKKEVCVSQLSFTSDY